MRKSNKCEYTIGVNTRKKRKFLRPEEAMAEASRLNLLPHVIKKCVAYKCTTCHFFHVGRTTEDIPRGPLMIPQPEPEELMVDIKEKLIEPIIEKQEEKEFNWEAKRAIYKDQKEPVKKVYSEKEHEDFDWTSDKRII